MPLSFPRPDFWDLFLITIVVIAIGGMVFPLSLGVSVPVIGTIFFLCYCIRFRSLPQAPLRLALWLILLMSLMGMSYFWAVWGEDSLSRTIKVISIIIPSYLLVMVAQHCPPETVQRHKNWIYVVCCVPVFLLAVRLYAPQLFMLSVEPNDIARFLDRSNFNKNAAIITLLVPSLFYMTTHKNYAQKSVLLAALIGLMIVTQSQASQLAILFMAALAFGLLPFLKSFTHKICGGALIILALLMPFLSSITFDLAEHLPLYQSFVPSTGLMRLENWDSFTREILKSPFVGFGVDSARHMTLTTDKIFHPADQLMHPHNGFLQMWVDFGLIGAIVMAMGLALYLTSAKTNIHFVTFMGSMIILLLSWSIWSSWLIGALFFIHVFVILATKSRSAPAIS